MVHIMLLSHNHYIGDHNVHIADHKTSILHIKPDVQIYRDLTPQYDQPMRLFPRETGKCFVQNIVDKKGNVIRENYQEVLWDFIITLSLIHI